MFRRIRYIAINIVRRLRAPRIKPLHKALKEGVIYTVERTGQQSHIGTYYLFLSYGDPEKFVSCIAPGSLYAMRGMRYKASKSFGGKLNLYPTGVQSLTPLIARLQAEEVGTDFKQGLA